MTPDKEIQKKKGKEKYTVRSIQADLFCGKTKSFKILKLIRKKYPESVRKERIGRSTVTTIEKAAYYEFISDYQLNEKRKIIEKDLLKIQNMTRKQLENLCLELCIQIENPILVNIQNDPETYVLNTIKYTESQKNPKPKTNQQVIIKVKDSKLLKDNPLTESFNTIPNDLTPSSEIDNLKKIIKKYIK